MAVDVSERRFGLLSEWSGKTRLPGSNPGLSAKSLEASYAHYTNQHEAKSLHSHTPSVHSPRGVAAEYRTRTVRSKKSDCVPDNSF